jgi:hypothetical protein
MKEHKVNDPLSKHLLYLAKSKVANINICELVINSVLNYSSQIPKQWQCQIVLSLQKVSSVG